VPPRAPTRARLNEATDQLRVLAERILAVDGERTEPRAALLVGSAGETRVSRVAIPRQFVHGSCLALRV
jgi:hypothetical protein